MGLLCLNTLVEGVHSDDPNLQLTAVTQLRKLLSMTMPAIEEVMTMPVLRLVQFLQCDDNPMLQYESAWALTNIAAGT